MNRENLTKMVDGLIGLRRDPKEVDQFTLEVWSRTNSCGTFGCAVGTAALKGWIPGLRLVACAPVFVPTGDVSWHAVMAAFDISKDEAQWLFSRHTYPEHVYDELRALDAVITRIAGVLAEGFPTITSAMLKKFPLPSGDIVSDDLHGPQ